MQIDKEFLIDGRSVIDIVVAVLPRNGPCASRNAVVEILAFDVMRHTGGIDICRDGMVVVGVMAF